MTTTIGGKKAYQTQVEWNLTKSKREDKVYITTNIDVELARILEYWATFLVSERKITNNSAYAASRYALENGIRGLDIVMQNKYGKRPEVIEENNAGSQDT